MRYRPNSYRRATGRHVQTLGGLFLPDPRENGSNWAGSGSPTEIIRAVSITSGASCFRTFAIVHLVEGAEIVTTPVGRRALSRAGALTFRSRSEEHTSELQSLMRISYAV